MNQTNFEYINFSIAVSLINNEIDVQIEPNFVDQIATKIEKGYSHFFEIQTCDKKVLTRNDLPINGFFITFPHEDIGTLPSLINNKNLSYDKAYDIKKLFEIIIAGSDLVKNAGMNIQQHNLCLAYSNAGIKTS